MKKVLIISLVLFSALILFVSCNSDADHGVYYQLASSCNKSNYEISGFLGNKDNLFYYYNSNGVYSYSTETKKHDLVVGTSSTNGIVSHAYFDGSNIYYQNRDGYIFKVGTEESLSTNAFSHLWENGYVTSETGLYKVTDLTNPIDSKEIKGSLIYEKSILYWDSENSYIYDGSTTTTITGYTNFNGFVKLGDTYYVSQYLTVAKVTDNGELESLKTFGYTLQDGQNLPMFSDGTYLYLKFSNLFYKYQPGSTVENPEITGGWAQSISGTTVVSTTKIDSNYYIATSDSGLYKADLTSSSNTSLL